MDKTDKLPHKKQGKIIALISGGIDSPVAAWMMMRAGCDIIALHFGDGNRIRGIIERLEEHSGSKIKLYSIPYEPILRQISEAADRYTCIICKRTMYRTAEKIARIEEAHGIVTGDNVGQVASQTLENMAITTPAVKIPIYRPLLGMDKEDTIKIARKIETYKLQLNKPCKFVPKKPITKAKIGEVERIEMSLDLGLDRIIKDLIQ